MDKITNALNPTLKTSYHPAILAAMTLACKKMDQYYSLTDSSPIYRIAMGLSISQSLFPPYLTHSLAVLHPGLKLEYFKRHNWEKDWIEQAEALVREEFMQKYANKSEAPSQTSLNAMVCFIFT
jgi:hypothetical protein